MGKQGLEGSEGIKQGLWRENVPARESGKGKACGRQMQRASWAEWAGGKRWKVTARTGAGPDGGAWWARWKRRPEEGAHQSHGACCGARRGKKRCLHKGRHHWVVGDRHLVSWAQKRMMGSLLEEPVHLEVSRGLAGGGRSEGFFFLFFYGGMNSIFWAWKE